MAYREAPREYGGGGGGTPQRPAEPEKPGLPSTQPANPTAPPAPDSPQATAGQQAQGVQEWDSPWERRARKILGSKNVGSAEDLADPEHRKWINRKLRKAKGAKADAKAAKPVEEVAEEEDITPDTGEPTVETEAGTETNLPVAQGSAEQLAERQPGEPVSFAMPERQVPGEIGGGSEQQPEATKAADQAAGFEGGEEEVAGPVGIEPALPGGSMPTAPQQPDQFMTNAGPAPPEYPQAPQASGNFAQPTAPWPPPPVQPTFYTGGM
ncbi:MAG: hypothetical protein GY906_24855 [bacterium]|nr:hypothetical protein [bacterium]